MEMMVALVARSAAIDDVQAGEVMEIRPDGWEWSQAELANPNWQLISAPILNTHAATLMKPHSWGERVRGTRYPRKAYLLDLSLLPQQEHFKAGHRVQSRVVLQNADVVNATIMVP